MKFEYRVSHFWYRKHMADWDHVLCAFLLQVSSEEGSGKSCFAGVKIRVFGITPTVYSNRTIRTMKYYPPFRTWRYALSLFMSNIAAWREY